MKTTQNARHQFEGGGGGSGNSVGFSLYFKREKYSNM
jgi:hypothetical protein